MGVTPILELGCELDHDRVELISDPETGLRGVIAIHSRELGPAMGGLRVSPYPDFGAAILDALRLSRAMTLKCSTAGLDLGGGKAVLLDTGGWQDPGLREARMRAFGRIVERLGGQYVTAEDVGTSPADMTWIGRETRWVAGRPVADGGRGDPSAATARTVFAAVQAGVQVRLGAESLRGLRAGIIGSGHVGSHLARLLSDAGAEVVVADIRAERAAEVAAAVGGGVADPDELILADLDIVCPCALGGAITPRHVGRLRARVIAGAANNQLSDLVSAAELARAGVLWVPDFLANCGGIIDVGAEVLGLGDDAVEQRLLAAELRIRDVLVRAERDGRTPWELAMELAHERIAATAPAAV